MVSSKVPREEKKKRVMVFFGTYLDEDENASSNIWRKAVRVQIAQSCRKTFDRLQPWQVCLAPAKPRVCLHVEGLIQPRIPLVGVEISYFFHPAFYQLVQRRLLLRKAPHRLRPYWALIIGLGRLKELRGDHRGLFRCLFCCFVF